VGLGKGNYIHIYIGVCLLLSELREEGGGDILQFLVRRTRSLKAAA